MMTANLLRNNGLYKVNSMNKGSLSDDGPSQRFKQSADKALPEEKDFGYLKKEIVGDAFLYAVSKHKSFFDEMNKGTIISDYI